MADVKDILPTVVANHHATPSPTRSKPEKRRVTGLRKEIANLQRDVQSLPAHYDEDSVEPMIATTSFRKKRKLAGSGKVSRWEWKGFTSSARTDDLVLHHWAPVRERRPDYHFAACNIQLEQITYTPEEYNACLIDKDWSRAETDLLIELCNRFDRRFIVVCDRFRQEYEGRDLEDIKDRYYCICRELKKHRSGLSGKQLQADPLFSLAYDKEYEKKRKQQAEKLYNRSLQEIFEEKTLKQQYSRIESERSKSEADKRKMMKLTETAKQLVPASRKRKKKEISLPGEESFPCSASSMAGNEAGKPQRFPGPYVQSARLATPTSISPKVAGQIDLAMQEMGIPRRVVATPKVSEAYLTLRNDMLLLLDLKSHLKKKEYDLRVARAKLALLKKEQNSKQACNKA